MNLSVMKAMNMRRQRKLRILEPFRLNMVYFNGLNIDGNHKCSAIKIKRWQLNIWRRNRRLISLLIPNRLINSVNSQHTFHTIKPFRR